MSDITHDPQTWPAGDLVWNVCRAIALAEGADVEGSAPDRYNNPGDLSKGDEHNQPVIGYVTLPDGEVEIHFVTKAGGWQALYKKIMNIRLGLSKVYKPSMSWDEMGKKYAGNSAVWSANVAAKLGIAPTDKIGAYFGLPLADLSAEGDV